ncbi:Aste57867_11139 [Aphanomyces stellatus]|uniref:RING-type E3 ubiquitin transferase n=1 Tax=Aphanomyces stellatus TaxID=120398 RepID=A0A485KS99_9STRA|nr:hypothetical protein As57867_011097 [Aphanomyces stellatus]VFT88006.1 Aste57867_11139 [Aphanomyces stellatus]
MMSTMHMLPRNSSLLNVMRANALDALKQVKVHSSATRICCHERDPFTVYTLIVACDATKSWWIIKKRYSEFLGLRKHLQSLVQKAKAFSDLKPLCALLQPILAKTFPKKHLRLDTEAIVAERKTAFHAFVASLMAIRSECMFVAPDDAALSRHTAQLNALLDTFLEVPGRHKAEERMRTSSLGLFTPPVDDPRAFHDDSHFHHHDGDNVDDCPICLDALRGDDKDDESVLRLACGHSFHESCVVHWLEQKVACPLCRQAATGGSIG